MQPGAELQTLFLAAKVRTKSKPPNKIKKKWRPTKKKWKNKQKGNKNERKTEAKRIKHRLRTNKNAGPKPRANSEPGAESEPRAKKEVYENPSKNIRVVF